jgi:ketosteroid isomerase-like protein
MRLPTLLCLLVLLTCFGCSSTPEPEPLDLDGERSALMAADQAWSDAYSSSESKPDAFVAALADGAHLLPPGSPLAEGKEAIHAAIADLVAIPGFSIAWTPSSAEVGDAGGMGITIGSYDMRMDGPEGGPIKIDGKYMTAWKQQPDGSWKVAADMFNANGPPTAVEE